MTGTTTGFLYDGLNTVQELTSGSPSANILSGLGVDEWLTRTDAAGTRHLLSDALGSTVALTDSAGAVPTTYTYEPFGASTVGGAASANPMGFTSREHDGTGLIFYRSRYYDPNLHRFTAEDPIGFAGGDVNLQTYVSNSPTMLTDPYGLQGFIPRIMPYLPRNVAGRVTRAGRIGGPAPRIRPGNWTEPPLTEIMRPNADAGLLKNLVELIKEMGDILNKPPFGSVPIVTPVGENCGKSGGNCNPPKRQPDPPKPQPEPCLAGMLVCLT